MKLPSQLKINSRERLVPFLNILGQWSPAFLPGTGFIEDNFFHRCGEAAGYGMIQASYIYYAVTDLTGGRAQAVM